MTRISLAAAVVVALGLAVGSAAMTHPRLTGTVGPGFTIDLKSAKGKKVTSLKAGTYRIAVTDKSAIHDYVLEGPGLGKKGRTITGIKFVGKTTKTVTFRRGAYTFVCTPHRKVPSMIGTFKVK